MNSHLPGIDLLRCIAILFVMLFHSFVVGGLGEDWEWLSRYGWMGVDLFFVISGFLIGTQVLRSHQSAIASGRGFSFKDFYLRRAFRIFPAFFVVLGLYLFWPVFREVPNMEPWWKFASFILNLSIHYPLNAAFSHAWSLCVEEHFYLFFPMLAWAYFKRPNPRALFAVCIAVMLTGIALRSAIWMHYANLQPAPNFNWYLEKIYYPTWNRLDGLLCGVVLAFINVMYPQIWSRMRAYGNHFVLLGAALLALSMYLFRQRTGLMSNAIGWPILSMGWAAWVFAAAGKDNVLGRNALPGTAWLAAISYSLYLVHKGMYALVASYWGTQLAGQGLLAVCAYGGASIGAAAILYYLVERPGMKLRQRFLLSSKS